MEKLTDKRSSAALLIMLILFVVLQAVGLLFFGFDYGIDLPWLVECFILLSFGILMYGSYRTHTKNIMKPALGATLAVIMYYNMNKAMSYLQDIGEIIDSANTARIVTSVSKIMIFAALALMNIMHYAINGTHHSSPKKIMLNKIFYVLFVVFSIVYLVAFCFTAVTLNRKISCCAGTMSDFFLVSMVLGIESFLDEFRLERETKTETEEN